MGRGGGRGREGEGVEGKAGGGMALQMELDRPVRAKYSANSWTCNANKGQTQPVDLVAVLPVNMHRVPRQLRAKYHFVPLEYLDLRIPHGHIEKRQVPKMEEVHGNIAGSK